MEGTIAQALIQAGALGAVTYIVLVQLRSDLRGLAKEVKLLTIALLGGEGAYDNLRRRFVANGRSPS